MPTPKTVAITGAGSGIGAEIAALFAARGCHLFLAGRDETRLAAIAERCTALGGKVHTDRLDVRHAAEILAWIEAVETTARIDLMIVNAGIFAGRPAIDAFEDAALAADVIRTNLTGAIQCAGAIAPRMAGRGAGHIVLIGSLAAYAPSADAQAYSASKAGLTAYGEALREDLADRGVQVTLVHPGHVRSRQTDQQDGPLPLIISAADAARRIVSAIDDGRSAAAFPWLAATWVRLARLLPWRLRARLNASSRFTVRNIAEANDAGCRSDRP